MFMLSAVQPKTSFESEKSSSAGMVHIWSLRILNQDDFSTNHYHDEVE